MTMYFQKSRICLIASGIVAMSLIIARADSISVTMDSNELVVGQPSQLTVTVTGSQTQPTVPNIAGLDIQPTGQSTQIEIVNGAMTASAANTYDVTPERVGTFVIPAIHAGTAASQPITVHVVDNGGASSQNAPVSSQGSSSLPNPAIASQPLDDSSTDMNKFGSIEINVPNKKFYVGQLVPVEIKAFIPDGLDAAITDLPQFTSDGLTLNSLSTKPDQTTELINGQPCTVMTWHSALTAVKSGTYSVELKMPESVVDTRALAMPNLDNDDFDSFFRNPFAGMRNLGRKKEVMLHSDDKAIAVMPLPLASRPADFSGAVGQFTVESSATPLQVNTGDPITLKMSVSGRGNFDRVSSPLLTSSSVWKTYGVKSHFEPVDSAGFEGVKTFEQPIIPNEPTATEIPSLSFSYFDPELQRYVSRTSNPIHVSVSGPALSDTPKPGSMDSTPPSPIPLKISSSGLRPNQVDEGATVSTLQPVFLQTWFWAAQSLPVFALLAGTAAARFRERQSAPAQIRANATSRAIQQHLAAMNNAITHSQTGSFFVHARSALQERLAEKWNLRPETITLADIDARGLQVDDVVRPVFQMADQASYSDLRLADTDLQQWRDAVMRELQTSNRKI